MLKKRFKKLIAAGVVLMALLPSMSTQAAADSFVVDNDSDSYSNEYTGSWQYLNSGMYGDSRIHWGNSDSLYSWIFNNPSGTGSYDFNVYLANNNFNSNGASYWKDGSGHIGTISQFTAKSGYTKVGWVWLVGGWKYKISVSSYNTGDNLNTGADAIKLSN